MVNKMFKSLVYFVCFVAFASAGTIATTAAGNAKNASDSLIDLVNRITQGAITAGQNAATSGLAFGKNATTQGIGIAQQMLHNSVLSTLTGVENANNTLHKMAGAVSALPITGALSNIGAKIGEQFLQGAGKATIFGGSAMNSILNGKKDLSNAVANTTQNMVSGVAAGWRQGANGVAGIFKNFNNFASNAFGSLFPF